MNFFEAFMDKNEIKCIIIDKTIRSAKKQNIFKLVPEKQSVISANQSIILTSTSTRTYLK